MTHLKSNEKIGIFRNRGGEDGLSVPQFRDFIFEQINSIGSMVLSNPVIPVTQIFNDTTFTTINGFDEVTIQTSLITPNTVNNTITVLENGIYMFTGGLSLTFPGPEELGVMWFVNNVAISPNPISLDGRGVNNSITTSWESIATLKKDDIVTMKAINLSTGNFTANMLAMFFTVKRIG